MIDFTISGDPEFVIEDNGDALYAADYCDTEADFGSDGSGNQFELRPFYSESPLDVVSSLRQILLTGAKRHPNLVKFNWRAGSAFDNICIGGHIHLGTKKLLDYENSAILLDNYLGVCTLLIENEREAITRRTLRRDYRYGQARDFREQDHGFEYRFCSSWLTSPYIATSVLCLAKTIVYEQLNNKNFPWKLQKDNASNIGFARKEKVRPLFPEIWTDIKKMKLYQKYKPHLDLIYWLVSKKLTWHPPCDMKEAWGIVNFNQPNILFDTIWAKYKQT